MTQQVSLFKWSDSVAILLTEELLLEAVANFETMDVALERQPHIALDDNHESGIIDADVVWTKDDQRSERSCLPLEQVYDSAEVSQPPDFAGIEGEVRGNYRPPIQRLHPKDQEQLSEDHLAECAYEDLAKAIYQEKWEEWKRNDIYPTIYDDVTLNEQKFTILLEPLFDETINDDDEDDAPMYGSSEEVVVRANLTMIAGDCRLEVESVEYLLPIEDVKNEDGDWPTYTGYASDRLKNHDATPDQVTDWDGPCNFEILYNTIN